ncbi:MAG: winged helix-turn-helix transcriptional regulator [archaeon]|jgi:Lrp/AsnC family leucine-responsive transcriptional regulator
MSPLLNLDKLDKNIITELNKNPRANYSEIAKKVKSSKEVVNYRIKNLESLGIIKEYVTIFGFGYQAHKTYLRFQKINSKEEEKLINFLLELKNINWITTCSGNWDLAFSIMAKNAFELDKTLREIFTEFPNVIQDYKLSTSLGSIPFGYTNLTESINENAIKVRYDESNYLDFDNKDKEIAKLLHKNARIKITEISKITKIPGDTINYRIKKMEKNKIIKRYRLIIDYTILGYNRFEILIRCTNLTNKVIEKFEEYAKQKREIEYISKYVGTWDLELTVNLKSNLELRNFIIDLKKNFPENINNLEIITLYETKNYTYTPSELL